MRKGQKKYFFLLGCGPPDRHAELETVRRWLPLPHHEWFELNIDGLKKLEVAWDGLSNDDNVTVFILSHGNDSSVDCEDGISSFTYIDLIKFFDSLWKKNNFTLVPCQCGATSMVNMFGTHRCFAPTTDLWGSTWSGSTTAHDGEILTVNTPLIQFISQDLQSKNNREALCKKYVELLENTRSSLSKDELHSAYTSCALATGVAIEQLEAGHLNEQAAKYPSVWVSVLVIVILALGIYLFWKRKRTSK